LAKSNAGMKLTQSFRRDTLTVTFLTYAATAATINNAKGLEPIGRPKITSVINPARKINPNPKAEGILKTQK
tara:strand:+ start:290 stop:505 length:216 start_codon:yes stop_codon:yes gene_type:complete